MYRTNRTRRIGAYSLLSPIGATSVRRARGSLDSLAIAAAVFLLIAAPGAAESLEEPEIPEPLTLDWCIERARRANPVLEGDVAFAEAAAHRVRSSGAFEDPRLSYEASNIPVEDFDFNSTPLSGHQLYLRQKLPFPGLLANRERAAEHSAVAAELRVEDRRFATDGAVEAAWAELGFAQQAVAITDRNIALLRQLAATAETRYRVGTGLQQDVLRAQVELTAQLQERLRRDESIERAEARVIELLDLPGLTNLPRSAELHFEAENPNLKLLIDSLEARSTRLLAARQAIEAAKAQIRVAEFEGLPDVDLGIGYRVRRKVDGDPVKGDDFVSAGLTLRLPVDRSKWRSRVAEQRALLRKAEAEYRAARAALVAVTRNAHAELVRASSEEALLETGLVPQARQSLEASRSAYKVGRIEFLSLLDSQVQLLEAELRLARARADRRLGFAALESATGEKLR
jgi:cobalt-zinc-cadmium efflux system outer membrane protein